MEERNYRFFELFTKVDNLCIEVYQNEHGLADYVEDMRSISTYTVEDIPDWGADLFQLITLRNIRSSLVNTPGAFAEDICSQEQLEWLENFYQRILDRKDPMALLESYGYRAQENSQNKRIEVAWEPEVEKGASSAHERHVNGIFIASLIVLLVIITCVVTVVMFLPADL